MSLAVPHPDTLQLLQASFATSPLGLAIFDRQLRYVAINDALAAVNGRPPADHIGRTPREMLPAAAAELVEPHLRRVLDTGRAIAPQRAALATPAEPDQPRDWEFTARPLRDARGDLIGVSAMAEDVTDRLEAEAALRDQQDRFQLVVENSMDLITLIDPDGDIVYASRAYEWILGLAPADLVATKAISLVHPEDRPVVLASFEEALTGGSRPTIDHTRMRHADGHWVPVEAAARGIVGPDGRPVMTVTLCHDITERLRAVEALRESEELLRTMLDSAWEPMVLHEEGVVLEANQALFDVFRTSREQMIGRNLISFVEPDQRPEVGRHLADDSEVPYEFRGRRADGEPVFARVRGRSVSLGGRPVRFASGQDLTALRESEERHRELIEGIDAIVWEFDLQAGSLTFASPLAESLFGFEPDHVLAGDFFYEHVHPDDLEEALRRYRAVAADGGTGEVEFRIRTEQRGQVWVRDRVHAVPGPGGKPMRLRGVMIDVTKQKEADAERAQLQEDLRQAQKMDAIGQLAGGVAHDFNNLLTAISGYAELGMRARSEAEMRSQLGEIVRSADRAAGLTSQLLAFSRKQPLRTEPLDLNEVVRGLQDMLARLIGAQVELVLDPAPGLRPVQADRTQLQQILLNLCVNARDAMPSGGTLTVATSDAERHGRHAARLTVTDTGVGMSEETLGRAFEPFYTTKEIGRGTGLGLAAVHGIVSQTGGEIRARSAPGEGSVFEVDLPYAASTADPAPARPSADPEAAASGETVLLVEDEEAVRDVAMRVLQGRGYRVVVAASGAEAVERFEEQPVDLLVTDAVMPQMSGRELYAELAERRPELPVLFMSGYTPDMLSDAYSAPRAAFLTKPFTVRGLARAVRELLDRV